MDLSNDYWTTTELSDSGFGARLRPATLRTGDEDLDRVFRSEIANLVGFPLKSRTVTTTTGKKGQQSTNVSETVVTELREEDVADERFTVPEHYEHRPLMLDEEQLRAAQADAEAQQQSDDEAAAAEPEEDDALESAKKKLSGLFGKKKKKD